MVCGLNEVIRIIVMFYSFYVLVSYQILMHIYLRFSFFLALDLRKVINELDSVVSKWFQIGIQLGVSESRLHQIEADHRTSDRCLSEVIIFWLNGNTNADITWESLITALEASGVNEKGLAKSLIQKYGVATKSE